MNRDFNPSRIDKPSTVGPADRTRAAASGADSASFGRTEALKAALNEIPLVRPEKVAAARATVSNTNFPPEEMMKAIASLLAEKMQ